MPHVRSTARAVALAAAVALALGVSGCTSDDDGATAPGGGSVTQTSRPTGSTAPPAALPEVDTVVAASGAEATDLVVRPGDVEHLWLAEREGRVRRMTMADGGLRLEPDADVALDLSDDTTTEAERGLLGIAFSPDGDTLYVSHTNAEGNTRVASYEMDGDRVDATSRTVLLAVEQPYPNHNGGQIAFGPDDQLWLGLGDGGSADDPENRAQDPDDPLGKMVRIDPESGDQEIVVAGLRNPWRWAFDTDGSLWIADVGQNATEEIDHLPADEIEGANLGWSGYEGSAPYLDGDGRRPDDAVPPVFEYSHDDGGCSITGGFPYRGKAFPELEGAFLFADYCAGDLRAVALDDGGRFEREIDLDVQLEQPVAFARSHTGEPYVLLQGGDIVRLTPAA